MKIRKIIKNKYIQIKCEKKQENQIYIYISKIFIIFSGIFIYLKMKYIRFNIDKFYGKYFSCCIYLFLENEMNKDNLIIRNYNRYCFFVRSE